jgi:hypothetical protein
MDSAGTGTSGEISGSIKCWEFTDQQPKLLNADTAMYR